MSFSNSLKFTNAGREVQLQALSAKPLIFTTVRMGDGELSSAISAMTSLVNERVAVAVNSVATNSKYATIEAIFKNTDLSEGFYWRELGVYVADPDDSDNRDADILYAYQNAGELAEYINSPNSSIIEKILRIPVFVGDVSDVSVNVDSIVQQDATVTQTEESTIDDEDFLTFYDASSIKNKKILFKNLKDKIINKLSSALESLTQQTKESISVLQENFISHEKNKSNPHSVTAKHVGLDKVPNVATNDQTPTYTESSSLANLVSGEKLSVAFGKIKKAIKDLIAHLSNKSNPHSVTAKQVGAASSIHSHSELIPKQAVYYPGTTDAPPDIDTITDGLMLIPIQFSKSCPVGGSFVYIKQLFYGGEEEINLRTQVAIPYGTKSGTLGSGIATRTHLGEGVWTDWEKAGEVVKDISDSFLSQVVSGCTVNSKSVYKCGKVISGVVAFNYSPDDDEETIHPFVIAEAYRPKVGSIQVQSSLKKDGELLFPNNITYIDSGVVLIKTFGLVYDSGVVSFSYICN